jgi:hypothetical protein
VTPDALDIVAATLALALCFWLTRSSLDIRIGNYFHLHIGPK